MQAFHRDKFVFSHLGKHIEADTGCIFQIRPVHFLIDQQLPELIALVLFLFIMLINVVLNIVLKGGSRNE